MQIPQHSPNLFSSLLIFIPTLTSALSTDCGPIVVNSKVFNLSPLSGPVSVTLSEDSPPSIKNTTYTIDPCKQLKRTKGVPKEDECPTGTRVCAIERIINTVDNTSTISQVKPIAGEYVLSSGGHLDLHWMRLKTSSSPTDREKDGLRLEMYGGQYPFGNRKDGIAQKAVVDFICDSKAQERRRRVVDDSGTEILSGEPEEDEGGDMGEGVDDGAGGKLKYLSYGAVDDDMYMLSLEWTTQYACEDSSHKGANSGNGHWGFFTWFIIILFLATAAYLIFGSWLNYNRYGARGWDLLPHGDTIRDVPYLLRDWTRRVMNTVQGGGSRGGYSAV